MASRDVQCSDAMMRGRLAKAQQFLEAAQTVRDLADDESEVGDAFATLCVHAGIAASDAICCSALGKHAKGDNHAEAAQLLESVRPDGKELANSLRTLLGIKTKAGYSAQAVNATERKRAIRAAEKLAQAARDRVRAD
jgi:predicted transposase YbfD/YdcC